MALVSEHPGGESGALGNVWLHFKSVDAYSICLQVLLLWKM